MNNNKLEQEDHLKVDLADLEEALKDLMISLNKVKQDQEELINKTHSVIFSKNLRNSLEVALEEQKEEAAKLSNNNKQKEKISLYYITI
jgi:hypothetical protein